MRDDEVDQSRAADLGDPVIGGHEEEGSERHRLPRHHEQVRVVGDQHERHCREKRVVFEADESRGGTLARPEVAGRKHRDCSRCCAQEDQEERGKRIDAQVERQVGQSERKDHGLRRSAEREECDAGDDECHQRAEHEQQPDDAQVARLHDAGAADHEPRHDGGRDQLERRRHRGFTSRACRVSHPRRARAGRSRVRLRKLRAPCLPTRRSASCAERDWRPSASGGPRAMRARTPT